MAKSSKKTLTKAQRKRADVANALALGWVFVGMTGGGHLRFEYPTGARVTLPSTPSEYRGTKNNISLVRRLTADENTRLAQHLAEREE